MEHSGATLVTDGKKAWRFLPALGEFTEDEAPESLLEFVSSGGEAMGGAFPLMAALLAPSPAEVMLAGVTGDTYVGLEDVDGVSCHRLRFSRDSLSWDAWVEAGKRHLLRKVVPDLSGVGGALLGAPGDRADAGLLLAGPRLRAEGLGHGPLVHR